MQTDLMDSEETVAIRSYMQQSTKMNIQTIMQSKPLTIRTIMNKLMLIEHEDNKTIKDPTMKLNLNKIMEIQNQDKQDHPTQPIPNKNQQIQIFHYPKTNLLQSPRLQNQAKFLRKLQFPSKGCNQPTIMILEVKQVNQSPYPINPQGIPKLKPTLTLPTTSYPEGAEKKGMCSPQLLKSSPQNTPKATSTVQDPKDKNKYSSTEIRQKQCSIPGLTRQIS
ncbi:MAG: hypothetical protein EZS28_000971 [Streblomastix strix]|uniref:Uncharacterized protein n=1 Tax=Streblomastix strix TaxID=222440 RepID=A0A5J4X9L7_9EUKA|nr:MAG: hypothetical protein EZS28_000971 [Streblomastix strix]